jgi:hypothetical protein
VQRPPLLIDKRLAPLYEKRPLEYMPMKNLIYVDLENLSPVFIDRDATAGIFKIYPNL